MTDNTNPFNESNFQKTKTIGILVDWFENEYQIKILAGAIEVARRNNINIYCIEGGCIHSQRKFETARNKLFDFVSNQEFDGLIILTAAIGAFANQEQIQEFCDQFAPIPIVSIANDIANHHSILINNTTGFRDLIIHLIEAHQYRNFAFISGPKDNQDSNIRYNTLKDTLAEFNIDLDPDLVIEGKYTSISGMDGMRTLLLRQKKIDVVVAANDEMAIGALYELNSKNIQVPDDIAVVGFDNVEVSAFSSPQLTTVEQPLYDLGVKAMDTIIDLINNKNEVPQKAFVPTKMVLRESCGCFSHTNLNHATDLPLQNQKELRTTLTNNKDRIALNIINSLPAFFIEENKSEFQNIIEKMIDALYSEILDGKQEEFVKRCFQILQSIDPIYQYTFYWQNIITELRRNLLPFITEFKALLTMEDALHQVRVMIAEKGMTREKKVFHEALLSNSILSSISEELLFTTSVPELVEVLAHRLPDLGISACYISEKRRKKGSSNRNFKLTFGYNNQGSIKINKKPFYFDGLVPEIILNDQQQHVFLIMVLYLSEKHFGTIGFEINLRNSNIYGTLRRIINSSLRGLILTKLIQNQEKYLSSQQMRLHFKNLEEIKKAMEGFISTLLLTIEVRDPYTAGHQSRVATLAAAIATEMKLPQEIVDSVRMAGVLHDLGKISIPVEILNKPGKLKETEFALIKDHPKVAYDILKNIDFPWPLAEIVLQHHERLDGSGYPFKLKGEAITLEAKILAVADVIEAMASHRPYRPTLGIEAALNEITKNQGIFYDPKVVKACLALFNEKNFKLSG
ncbi:MAG TPA: substrate-binding domain-containing protein [Bacillota bacterium]|nr:substrate-binding domain-containing protein [Bacillota bacterium]